MRAQFDEQLASVNNNLIEMGGLIENAIALATEALVNQDAELAQSIMDSDNEIDDKEKEIEAQCLRLLLIRQPVAKDFRAVSAALRMITDMERIGDHASDISEICMLLAGQNYIKNLDHIQQMAAETSSMVTQSIDAFVNMDGDLARKVIEQDDVVDDLFVTVKNDLIALVHENAENGEQAFDLLQIAKYYERIGDHAVNNAEWVIFLLTGVHKDRQVL